MEYYNVRKKSRIPPFFLENAEYGSILHTFSPNHCKRGKYCTKFPPIRTALRYCRLWKVLQQKKHRGSTTTTIPVIVLYTINSKILGCVRGAIYNMVTNTKKS